MFIDERKIATCCFRCPTTSYKSIICINNELFECVKVYLLKYREACKYYRVAHEPLNGHRVAQQQGALISRLNVIVLWVLVGGKEDVECRCVCIHIAPIREARNVFWRRPYKLTHADIHTPYTNITVLLSHTRRTHMWCVEVPLHLHYVEYFHTWWVNFTIFHCYTKKDIRILLIDSIMFQNLNINHLLLTGIHVSLIGSGNYSVKG